MLTAAGFHVLGYYQLLVVDQIVDHELVDLVVALVKLVLGLKIFQLFLEMFTCRKVLT